MSLKIVSRRQFFQEILNVSVVSLGVTFIIVLLHVIPFLFQFCGAVLVLQ